MKKKGQVEDCIGQRGYFVFCWGLTMSAVRIWRVREAFRILLETSLVLFETSMELDFAEERDSPLAGKGEDD